MYKHLALFVFLTTVLSFNSHASELEKAKMQAKHGLINESRSTLIEIIFSDSSDNEKAESLHILGNLAFEQKRTSLALETWNKLIKTYPDNEIAKQVVERVKELSEVVGETAKTTIENAVAASYLRHGDFWSDDKNNTFIIDSSWIPKVEAALKWYDKVISEFPGSNASKVAYEEKMKTLLGWKERGKYGSSFGIKENFAVYMPQLLETYQMFEKEHPNAVSIQAFRYQIAQAYWGVKDWPNTRKWLNIIIDSTGSGESFYKDTARRRLQKIEY